MSTVLKSYWIQTNYEVHGQQWFWLSALLEINMVNAITRILGGPITSKGIVLTEHSDSHWSLVDPLNHRKTEVRYEIWQQMEQPPKPCEERCVISDNRPAYEEVFNKMKIEEQKLGRKKLPAQIKF